MKDKGPLIREIFELSGHIRYIAVYDADGLAMQQRGDIDNASSGESDKYEELLVNPTLIKLASQRGDIGCGGLRYFIIRYGHFFVLLLPTAEGHVNIGVEPDKDPLLFVEPLMGLVRKHGL